MISDPTDAQSLEPPSSDTTRLYLPGRGLTEVPEWLGQLTQLQALNLQGNRLTELPEWVGQLNQLQSLDLRGNLLTALPNEFGQLTRLRELNLGDNRLAPLNESLGLLTQLDALYLWDNHLTSLPEWIGQLTRLRYLNLQRNQLETLPERIGRLTRLETLYLARNELASLPESLRALTSLKRLFLHENDALGLPPEVLGPTGEDVLRTHRAAANPKEILEYYFRTRGEPQPLNEAKLILVGHGFVGKTSLVKRLVDDEFDRDEPQTPGIRITQWPIRLGDDEEVRLHIWDFGGQEIMHATHQFFLTQRSLYLLVLNGRQGHEDADADYWLNLIKSFGEDSPVIVVLNKIKDLPFDVNRRALKQKFPAIRAFVETDCAEPMGIEELRQLIERETDRLEHLRDAFPGSWFAIKGRLAGMEENYLLPDEYRGICVEHGEADPVAQGLLAGYLHTLGIALNYRDDPRLDDTHVLNPHWVTNGIYTILNAEDVAKQRGELAVTDVGEILDPADYPQDRHRFLLELMRRFELCFRFPEAEDRYLVPELLDKQQPPEAEDFAPEDCLNFEYRYPVLPEGLLPRFIVRTYVRSTGEPRWRTGVLLEFEGNRALVKADVQDKRVSIAVSGPQDGRRRLLAVIRSDFEHIHQSFIFQPAGMVPVPDHPDVLVPYEELVVMEQGGVRTLPKAVGGEVLQLDVTELLNGVDLEGTRKTGAVAEPTREEASGAARLFYSYSHKDEELRDELETHLKLLERRGVIEPWHDRRIGAGEEWRDQIDEDLEAADIILLLVSADFMASDYCYELETKRAVERHDAGEARVIPVIVRDVARHGAPFSKLQALPTDGKAVRTWPDRDTAWRTVAEGIERAVADLRRSRDERANDRRPGQGEAARSEMRGTGEREDAAQTGSGGPSITITGSVTGSNIGAVGRGDQQQSVTGPQPGVANVQQLAGPPAPTSAESTVVAVLFSDLKGYSLLQEPQRKRLHARADKDTAAILDRYEPLAKKFTGDGLVAAFGGTREAANCALDLSAYYRDLDWDALEVPALAMRIALHSGEASIAPHPLSGEPDMEGEAVIVAARIEPEVTPGEVWATDTCIGLLADRNQGGRFAWDDLGEHELAKAAGTRHLYRLRRS